MCGISAIYKYSNITKRDADNLKAMNQEMWYRGPDENGVWTDDKCGLAHTRLSIIGLDNGSQPLFNEDKSLVLICNGEIYNYVELTESLKKKGHIFSSSSDSETILHLYEEYGQKCLNHLRGQFAFCLWDTKKKQLFVARDRIGEKVLYYSQVSDGIVVSSELKAILKAYIPKPQLNLKQLASPIRYTAPLSNKDTFVEQIKRVEPGQYLLIGENGLLKYTYWKRSTKKTFLGTFEEAKIETLRLMRESVNIHMRADVPVAVMLSGGVDSSAIAALAKQAGREVHTITAGYKGEHNEDEREIAKRFAKEQGFIYHEVELDASDFNDSFEELTAHIDEPITDSAAIAQWALYKKVKSLGFKVLLGGMGGDELFYGYPYWNQMAKSLSIHREHQSLLPWTGSAKKKKYLNFMLKNWKHVILAGYPKKIEDKSIGFWMHDDYYKFSNDAEFSFDNVQHQFNQLNLSFNFENSHQDNELDIIYKFSFDKIMTMAYLYLSDRLGMGNSIEIRSPLLDYKLVDFVSSLPKSIVLPNNEPKDFLKQVLHGIVPDYILYAQKKGFTPPNSFIQDVVNRYEYKVFKANHKYYNSIVADRLLSLLVAKES